MLKFSAVEELFKEFLTGVQFHVLLVFLACACLICAILIFLFLDVFFLSFPYDSAFTVALWFVSKNVL